MVTIDGAVNDRRLGVVIPGPCDIVLPSGDVLQPDLMAFFRPRREAGRRGVIPDLVIEVIDSTTRTGDLGRK